MPRPPSFGPATRTEGTAVYWDQVEGNWRHVKGKVKAKWDRLTADGLMAAAGRRDRLVGKLVERYGYAKE